MARDGIDGGEVYEAGASLLKLVHWVRRVMRVAGTPCVIAVPPNEHCL